MNSGVNGTECNTGCPGVIKGVSHQPCGGGVGGIKTAMYVGFSWYFMAPLSFLKHL